MIQEITASLGTPNIRYVLNTKQKRRQIHRHINCQREEFGKMKCKERFPFSPHEHNAECPKPCPFPERARGEGMVSPFHPRVAWVWDASVNMQVACSDSKEYIMKTSNYLMKRSVAFYGLSKLLTTNARENKACSIFTKR